jgi:hypothetical protein
MQGKKMYTDSISQSIVKLKNEFVKGHKVRSIIYEVIPLLYSTKLPIVDGILSTLNNFAESNSIYFESTDVYISGIPCRAYDGDINDYWLSSKKYDTNYQPFYPTWILSAYVLSLEAKRLGFEEVVDIGSGDGRIAYCSKLLGLKSVGIEIDTDLVNLQYKISNLTNIKYRVLNEDATAIEYSSLNLSKPIFFISGLPESGEMLARNVLEKVGEIIELKHSAGFNFMGSHIMKGYSRDKTKWGWGKIIEDFDLDLIGCLTLPSHWTNDQKMDTAYVYTRYK